MKKPFLIGTYHLQKNARDERHIKEIADCGIDFIIGLNRDSDALDLFEKYGLGAVVEGAVPGWWGGKGENAGTLKDVNPLEKYDEKARDFIDHPAIWGVCSGDEPSALDFPYYGKVIEKVKELFPKKFPYLNLYANYGVLAACTVPLEKQFGTGSYEEYLKEYAKYIPLDYLSFDNYPYSATTDGYIENLAAVSKICRETGREMWVVAQVNSHTPDKWITENQLRFQANTALAFGAARLTWACYSAGWWHNQVLDGNGEKTEQYEKLKKVNRETKHFAEILGKYKLSDTVILNGEADFPGMGKIRSGCPMIAGRLTSDQGNALFVCPIDDPADSNPKEWEIDLSSVGKRVTVHTADETISAFSEIKFTLFSSHGAVVTTEEYNLVKIP